MLTRRREVAGHEAPAGALGRRGPLQAVKVFGARRDRVAGRGGNFEERGNCRRLDQILRAVVVRFDNHEALGLMVVDGGGGEYMWDGYGGWRS